VFVANLFSAKLNPLFYCWKKGLRDVVLTITGVQSIIALKRRDIIGPKALLFVILFHSLREQMFFSLEGGGFGVDLFFVLAWVFLVLFLR